MATLDCSGSEHWTPYFCLGVELWCPSKLLWSSDYMTFTHFEMEWGIHRPRLGGQCQGAAESLSTCFTFFTQFRKKEECNILMIYACKIPIYVLETCLTHPCPAGNFAEKCVLKLVQQSSSPCLAIKSLIKLTTKLLLAAFWSRCKILAGEVEACTESKISKLSLLPSSFAYLASFFFAGHLVGFILVGKVLGKL